MTTVQSSDRSQKKALNALNNVTSHFFNGDRYTIPVMTECTVWTGPSNIYPFATALSPTTHISSSSAADTGPVFVEGLDVNWRPKAFTVTLAGQTKTPLTDGATPVPLLRLNSARALVALTGDVYMYQDVSVTNGVPDLDDAVQGYIDPVSNKHQAAVYTVPEGFTAKIEQFYYQVLPPSGGVSTISVHTRPFIFGLDQYGPEFREGRFPFGRTATTISRRPVLAPFSLDPRTDIWNNIVSTGANSQVYVSAEFELIRVTTPANIIL